ncbi:hypothetical protein GCM10027299_03390 [Larkinella ripae]
MTDYNNSQQPTKRTIETKFLNLYEQWIEEWIQIVACVESDLLFKQMGREIDIDLNNWRQQLISIREDFDSNIALFQIEIEDNIFSISDEPNRLRYLKKLDKLPKRVNQVRDLIIEQASFIKTASTEFEGKSLAFSFYHIAAIALPSCFGSTLSSIYKEAFKYEINFTEEEPPLAKNFVKTVVKPDILFKWIGNKTDLAELIWALAKSERISDTESGQAITQEKLSSLIESGLGISIDVTGLMKGRMRTYKVTKDGNTFTKTLFDLVNERAASS